ncbi:hypothetical protein KIN20_012842 [Parelaphostrongylus tenuis]|uniref:Uncharacterized protein n=1 Tax=Parelaphostrongylus tenuis TaxID=148309 RepID=A0AAD5MCQ3_PARTN|nr:hypothetical protein KIN20_012842 [Parelaphostrongylus tenuis]
MADVNYADTYSGCVLKLSPFKLFLRIAQFSRCVFESHSYKAREKMYGHPANSQGDTMQVLWVVFSIYKHLRLCLRREILKPLGDSSMCLGIKTTVDNKRFFGFQAVTSGAHLKRAHSVCQGDSDSHPLYTGGRGGFAKISAQLEIKRGRRCGVPVTLVAAHSGSTSPPTLSDSQQRAPYGMLQPGDPRD